MQAQKSACRHSYTLILPAQKKQWMEGDGPRNQEAMKDIQVSPKLWGNGPLAGRSQQIPYKCSNLAEIRDCGSEGVRFCRFSICRSKNYPELLKNHDKHAQNLHFLPFSVLEYRGCSPIRHRIVSRNFCRQHSCSAKRCHANGLGSGQPADLVHDSSR